MTARIGRLLGLAAVAALGIILAAPARPAAAAWTTSTILTTKGFASDGASIAVDGRGMWHIVYAERGDANLRYLRGSRDRPDLAEQVLSDGVYWNEVRGAALALDADGQPHVVFIANSSADSKRDVIVYGRRTVNGFWLLKEIAMLLPRGRPLPSSPAPAAAPVLAVDRRGDAHIAYVVTHQPGGNWLYELRYARIAATPDAPAAVGAAATVTESVATESISTEITMFGGRIDLALHADGTPAVTFVTGTINGPFILKYAQRSTDGWRLEPTQYRGLFGTRLATGKAGETYFALTGGGTLRLARRAADGVWSEWDIDETDPFDSAGDERSIVVDAGGDVYIGYSGRGPVKLAKLSNACTGECVVIEEVAPIAERGSAYLVSAALGPKGEAYILYEEAGVFEPGSRQEFMLKLARPASGGGP